MCECVREKRNKGLSVHQQQKIFVSLGTTFHKFAAFHVCVRGVCKIFKEIGIHFKKYLGRHSWDHMQLLTLDVHLLGRAHNLMKT